ncbi:MAG: NAD(+) kinase [Clostridia bacterium]|nr:MAG: NAD(+) kinase [Clostridia bacterium]
MRLGILTHPKIPISETLGAEIADWLQAHDIDIWMGCSWDTEVIGQELASLDMLIALGGDGTLLRTARLAAPLALPILGVNLGRLGFLAEVAPDAWQAALKRILNNDYWVEKRLMLRIETRRDGQQVGGSIDALNEVVVSRGGQARVVRITTEVNGTYLTTYVADGVIVSTPTGSTAYALAAGGPIMAPELQNLALVPIAPHLSLARPLIMPPTTMITLKVRTDHRAILTTDGQFYIDLEDGDRVTVAASPDIASFIRLGPRDYFYQSLMERLQWTI